MPAWTEDKRKKLAELAEKGLSARVISKQMGATRNAVIGALARYNVPWPGRGQTGKRFGSHAPPRVRRVKPVAPVAKPAPIAAKRPPMIAIDPVAFDSDAPARESIETLQPHHCRWIPGDPRAGGKIYCGARREPGQAYCDHHRAMGTEPFGRKHAAFPKTGRGMGHVTVANAKEFTDA